MRISHFFVKYISFLVHVCLYFVFASKSVSVTSLSVVFVFMMHQEILNITVLNILTLRFMELVEKIMD